MISRDLWESQGDRRLLRGLDADLASAARRAGGRLACRVGCTECCIGPFPITLLDAHRLAEGLQRLAEQIPARAAAIRKRASAALRILRRGFPGDPATGRLDENETARERFFARHGARPCAALDPKTGACELYEHRPLTCRTYGPLARLDFQDMTGDFADPSLEADIPTDDWPFFYMPGRVYPRSYLFMVGLVLLLSAAFFPGFVTERPRFNQAAYFFLGAGFMLVETKGITELGLALGNTW